MGLKKSLLHQPLQPLFFPRDVQNICLSLKHLSVLVHSTAKEGILWKCNVLASFNPVPNCSSLMTLSQGSWVYTLQLMTRGCGEAVDDDGAESCGGGGSQRSREEGQALEELAGKVRVPTMYKGKHEFFVLV